MALTLDPATKIISIPQADLTFVSGSLYTLDTDQFRKDVMDLLASEAYIWLPDAFIHNTAVTVAGTTFARTLEFINGFSITFENLLYSVRLEGSNNNIFDVENGILNPSGNVTVIPTNSAGLIVTSGGGGLTSAQDITLSLIEYAVAGNATVSTDNLTVTIKDDDSNTVRVLNVSSDGRIRTIQ